ncbi:hypothetical protein AMTR_s00020p00113210 [Amborella trichopoda]|uniref:Uncharacterized protein n=1 Tax=Amborella trichopoda TaxID=13333 RepID=W1PUW1_AMBTC|nr:hypothetical protein AMTR_s00020p00113210 [Amborella trichopoda]
MKYQALEGQKKIMRVMLQILGVDDLALIEPYDETYLDGFANLPMNFLPPEFRNHFGGKGDPRLHITIYILVVPAI